MRISDWSSDVCSSDLIRARAFRERNFQWVPNSLSLLIFFLKNKHIQTSVYHRQPITRGHFLIANRSVNQTVALWISRSEERRVGKSVSVRVDLGGRRIIKKTKLNKNYVEDSRK